MSIRERRMVEGLANAGPFRAPFLTRAIREGTRIHDRVEYALPAQYFIAPVHAVFVRPMIEKIFAYRREIIARVLG